MPSEHAQPLVLLWRAMSHVEWPSPQLQDQVSTSVWFLGSVMDIRKAHLALTLSQSSNLGLSLIKV